MEWKKKNTVHECHLDNKSSLNTFNCIFTLEEQRERERVHCHSVIELKPSDP